LCFERITLARIKARRLTRGYCSRKVRHCRGSRVMKALPDNAVPSGFFQLHETDMVSCLSIIRVIVTLIYSNDLGVRRTQNPAKHTLGQNQKVETVQASALW
jgi:hypothetical protein